MAGGQLVKVRLELTSSCHKSPSNDFKKADQYSATWISILVARHPPFTNDFKWLAAVARQYGIARLWVA